MPNYKINLEAKEGLKRIYIYGVLKFGVVQADKYYDSFFEQFEKIAQNPLSFQSVDFIRKGYRRCPCGSDSIYYKIENGIIEIMAIIGKQEFNSKS